MSVKMAMGKDLWALNFLSHNHHVQPQSFFQVIGVRALELMYLLKRDLSLSVNSQISLIFEIGTASRFWVSGMIVRLPTGSDLKDGSRRYGFFHLAAFPGYQETL